MIMIFVSNKYLLIVRCISTVGIVNRKRWGRTRIIGAEVEVLDADMSVVASKVVENEQGESPF